MKNILYTSKTAAVHVQDVTGLSISTEAVKKLLSSSDLSSSFSGHPLTNGKLFGPMAIRKMHAKLLPERAAWLSEEMHEALPPVLLSYYAKGGTGKTSISVNVAIALARQGYRVLFIDVDPQSSSTSVMFDIDNMSKRLMTWSDVTFGYDSTPVSISQASIPTLGNGVLDVIPASERLGEFEGLASRTMQKDSLFKNALNRNAATLRHYDIIIVDSNPLPTSLLNISIILRCDGLMMPVTMDRLSMSSLSTMNRMLSEMAAGDCTEKTLMVVANQYNPARRHGVDGLYELANAYGSTLMSTVIPESTAMPKQGMDSSRGSAVVEREPSSTVARKLTLLAAEVAEKVIWIPKGMAVRKFTNPEVDALMATVAA